MREVQESRQFLGTSAVLLVISAEELQKKVSIDCFSLVLSHFKSLNHFVLFPVVCGLKDYENIFTLYLTL